MADHFEEVTALRISALEARVHDEAMAVREYFLEQQQFITHSLDRLAVTLRAEWRADIGRLSSEVNAHIDGLDVRLEKVETRLDKLEARFDTLEARFDKLETKLDVQHAAMQSLLVEIARRLPGPHQN